MPNIEEQDKINKAEWENPENWGGPRLMKIYFSKKDSRIWVPRKGAPSMGWTVNMAHTKGVLWFWSIFVGLFLAFIIMTMVILFLK